jgi:hypothetical protein
MAYNITRMKIAFANLLAAPFVFTALYILYYAWTHAGDGSLWLIPFLLIAALIWVLSPQINWWWYSKRPPALEQGVVAALEQFSRFYQRQDAAGKQRFRERLALTRMATDWTPMGTTDEAVPPDVQTSIASQQVIITWEKEDFLFPDFEKVIISPEAFLSPELPYNHHSETYAPEKCLIFNAKSMLDAFTKPQQYFNIALYEYAKVYMLRYGTPELPAGTDTWEHIEATYGWTRQQVEQAVGVAGLEPLPVAVGLRAAEREW